MGCAFTVDVYRQMDWGSALTSWWWQATIPHTMLAWQQRSLPQCNNLMFCPTSCYWAVQLATGLKNNIHYRNENYNIYTSPVKGLTNHKAIYLLTSTLAPVILVSHLVRPDILTCKVCQGLGSTTLKVWQLVDAKYWIIYGRTNKFQATTQQQTLGPIGY